MNALTSKVSALPNSLYKKDNTQITLNEEAGRALFDSAAHEFVLKFQKKSRWPQSTSRCTLVQKFSIRLLLVLLLNESKGCLLV